MSEKIGFVGVGRMGSNMARRLKDCGWDIAAIYDAQAAVARSVAGELGAPCVTELSQMTARADIIFTVVNDDRAMKAIFTGGLLRGARGKLFINCATVTPALHQWIEQKAQRAGAQSLEACMASSITQALDGTLYLMCAGRREVFESVRDVLVPLSDGGRLLRYIGTAGQAAQLKALVNTVMNINTAGLA